MFTEIRPVKPAEKSSFKSFFTNNFLSSRNFNRSFNPSPTTRPQRSTPLAQSIKQMSHVKFSAKTWDSLHMNAFLQRNSYAEKGKSPVSAEFLSQNEGFPVEFLRDYKDFPDKYSKYNPLVTLKGKEISSAPDFYQKFVEKPSFKGNFPDGNGYLEGKSRKSDRLSSAKEKLAEMKDLKKTMEEFHEAKSQLLLRNKRYRILKSRFNSGVLSLDNPENIHTVIYKDEYQENKEKTTKNEFFKEKKRKILENCAKTNENIAFFNRNYDKNKVVEAFLPKKHKNSEIFMKKHSESYQRVFGEEAGSFTKRSWLRGKETREIDIISFKKNTKNANF